MLKPLKIVLSLFFRADFFIAQIAFMLKFEVTDKVWGR
jgi:hypothetical protein